MKKIFLVAFAVVLGLTACKKDDEVKLSNLEMLQAHKWKYSAMTRTNDNIVTDLLTEDNCIIDDVHEFKTDMQVIQNTGIKKCSPTEEEVYTATYSLNASQDSIKLTAVSYLIKNISLDKMEWETKQQDGTIVNLEFIKE